MDFNASRFIALLAVVGGCGGGSGAVYGMVGGKPMAVKDALFHSIPGTTFLHLTSFSDACNAA